MAIRPETQDKYRKALISLFTKLKKGEKVKSSEFCNGVGVSPTFFNGVIDAKIIEPIDGGRHQWKWIESRVSQILNTDETKKTQYFFELANIVGEKMAHRKSSFNNDVKSAKRRNQEQEFDAEVERRLNLRLGSLAPSPKMILTEPEPLITHEIISLENQQFEEPKYECQLNMTKSEGRLMLVVLGEMSSHPYYKRFCDNMSNKVFEQVY
jgi:hypothetical protein